MTIYGWLSLSAQVIGLAFVVADLYRRTPSWQRTAAGMRFRVGVWLRRLRFWRSTHRTVELSGVVGSVSFSGEARLSARPGPPPGHDAPVEERLQWVEQAVDIAFRELEAEAAYRDKDVRNLVETVGNLRTELESDVATLRQRDDEARVPERLESWAALFVFVGIVFAIIDAVVRSAA